MLFNTIKELQPYISVGNQLSFSKVESHLRTASDKWIKKYLGKPLYDKLIDDFGAGSADPKHLALLEQSRAALAPLGYELYIPFGQVQADDAGFRTIQTENHRAAYRWQVEKLQQATRIQGFNNLESLMQFLESNKADYPLWDYAETHKHLINSATELDELVRIDESLLIYLSLLPSIRRAERRVSRIMSKAQLEELKQAIASDSLTSELEELWQQAKPAVAHLAFSEGIRSLPISFKGERLTVFHADFVSDFDPNSQPDPDILAYLVRVHKELGEQAEESLMQFLHENAPEYPLFMASDAYILPDEPIDEDIDFIDDTGFFFA